MKKVISGGQTGVDQGALRAAAKAGIPTGGWAPAGWLTEKGPAPWLKALGLACYPEPGYPARTRANVLEADLTVILTYGPLTGGSLLTAELCREKGGTCWLGVDLKKMKELKPKDLEGWRRFLANRLCRYDVVNFAGTRESKHPGVAALTEYFLLPALEAAWKRTPKEVAA